MQSTSYTGIGRAAMELSNDNCPRPVRESTTEERAAEFKRQITEHLLELKAMVAAAEEFGFEVSFCTRPEVRVTLTKTF